MDSPTPAQPRAADADAELMARLERSGSVDEMPAFFVDPRDAFVCSPRPIALGELARIYSVGPSDGQTASGADQDSRLALFDLLRRRCASEGWREQRTVFQTRRVSARRDAILDAEAAVWAMLGLEWHSLRIRGMWDRWEALAATADRLLRDVEAGRRPFSADVRDLCKELRELETEVARVMPQLGLPERAVRVWGAAERTRSDQLEAIEKRLLDVEAGARSDQVLDLVDSTGDGGSVR